MSGAFPGPPGSPVTVSVFVRVVPSLSVTGTFKHRKVELREQGYTPSACGDDPLYVLLPGRQGYEPLTEEVYTQIQLKKVGF